MKLKFLLLSAISAFALSVSAQTGTLLFYEDFNNGDTAESNPDIAAYKVDDKFYLVSPIADADYFHGPKSRWEYPRNSQGTIWRPSAAPAPDPNPSFYFKLKTADFEYAYLSLASLYWGNYRVSYSFDNNEYTDFDKDAMYRFTSLPLFEDGGSMLRNWWYDQFIENIGGKEVVYIEFECLSGMLQMDDIQITGYNTENGYTEVIAPLLKASIEGVAPEAKNYYNVNAEKIERHCETKMQKLDIALDTIQIVLDKGTEATLADYYNAYKAMQSSWDLAYQQRDDIDEPINTGDDAKYARELAAYEANQKAQNDFSDATAKANEVIAAVEAFKYADLLPETLMLEFEALFTEADEILAFCETGYVQTLADDLALICTTTEEEMDRIQKEQDEISSEYATTEAFFVYPNPADAEIRIAGAAGGNIYIFNAAGQQVLSITNYQGTAISVNSLAAGIYKVAYGRQATSFIKK